MNAGIRKLPTKMTTVSNIRAMSVCVGMGGRPMMVMVMYRTALWKGTKSPGVESMIWKMAAAENGKSGHECGQVTSETCK